MIQLTCPDCDSTQYKKKGFTKLNKQRYQCKDCGRQYIEDSKSRAEVKTNYVRLNDAQRIVYVCPQCEDLLEYNDVEKMHHCENCNLDFSDVNGLTKADFRYIARKSREVQRKRDELRIQNKILREDSRKINAMEEFGKELLRVFKEHSEPFQLIDHKTKDEKCGGILQFSDAHFNELVMTFDRVGNEYDFEIASKRCYSYIQDAMKYFDAHNVKTVWFCMLGDMLNSDRRPDELINKAASRANAYFIALSLIEQMILHLNTKYKVFFSAVSGNESRLNLDYSNAKLSLQDNFDYMILQQLRIDFEDKKGIDFLDIDIAGDIVEFFGKTFYVIHGTNEKNNDSQKNVQSKLGKMTFKGMPFDYMLTAHFHSTKICDTSARNSALVGSNVYSDKDLDLYGKAAQNIHIVNSKFIHSTKIDLQDNYGDEYYKYDKHLEVYDRKSLDKLKRPKKIIKIY